MSELDPYAVEVGRRLRVTAWELGFRTQQALAKELGATIGQIDTWYNGRALPQVKFVQKLCGRHGVTLDWIYRGVTKGLSPTLHIRVTSALEFDEPAPDVMPEPEAAAEGFVAPPASPSGKKTRKRWSVYRRRLKGKSGILA